MTERDLLQNNYLQVLVDEMDHSELCEKAAQRIEFELDQMSDEDLRQMVRQRHPELLPKQKYNHAFTVAFTLHSHDEYGEDVTPNMLRQAIAKVLYTLDDDSLVSNAGAPIDTFEVFDDHLKEND